MNIFSRQYKKPSEMNRTESEKHWFDLIQGSEKWMKSKSLMGKFDEYSNMWDHKFSTDGVPRFNLSYIVGSSMVSSLVFQRPGIVNTPQRPQFQSWAQFFDSIDNWILKESEYKDVLEDSVLYAFQQNVVGIEVNYDFAETPEEYMEFKPIQGSVDRTRKTNQPWFDLIPMEQLRLAKDTKNMRNCWWYSKQVKVATRLLKEMSGVNKENISITEKPSNVVSSNVEDAEEAYTYLWVIREAEENKWGWLSTSGKIIKEFDSDPMQIDGLPMELLTFNKSTKSIWATPDIEYIRTQHIEGDESRYDGRVQSRGANLKIFYDNNLLDEDDITKFLSDDALGCIPVQVPGDKSLRDVIHEVQPHVQMERFQYQKQLLEDAQYITGVGYNQMGTFNPGRRTKYEAQIVEERSFLRGAQRRTKIAEITEKLFRRVNQIVSQEWTAPIVQKVVGMEGAIYWVKAMPSEFSDVAAELVTTVNAESLAPTSKERKKQEMVEVMNVIAKFSKAMPGVNLLPVIKGFLSQFDWADVTAMLPQAENGGEQSMQQFQQNQQAMQQNPNMGQIAQQNLLNMMPALGRLPAQGQATQGEGNE